MGEIVLSSNRKCKNNYIQSFRQFVELAGRKNEVMTENDVWNACKKISVDIT